MLQYKTDFHVVGIPWQGPAAAIVARTAEIGQPVNLVPEPNNPVDPDAIAVYLDGTRIGYVPNRGFSCATCHQVARSQDSVCPQCGSSELGAWGLAGRLVRSKSLMNGQWAAYVSGVETGSKDGYVRCTLIIMDV